MKNSPCILTLDFGTQSVRAAIIDKNGNIRHIVKEPYQPAYFSTKKGYVFPAFRRVNGPYSPRLRPWRSARLHYMPPQASAAHRQNG